MIIAAIEDWTRSWGAEHGEPGGRVFMRDDTVILPDDSEVPMMVTAWTPTPAEIWRLCNGANVHVMLGETVEGDHPPIMVVVGNLPEGGLIRGITVPAPKDAPGFECDLPSPYANNPPPPAPPERPDEDREAA